MAHLKYASGKIATVVASRVSVEERRDFSFTSSIGETKIDLIDNSVKTSSMDANSFEIVEYKYEKRDHLLLEHEAFHKLVQEGGSPVININDALDVMKMIDMTELSISEKKEVFGIRQKYTSRCRGKVW